MTVRIGSGLIDMLERTAWHAAPNEACALLLGSITDSVVEIENAVVTDNVTEGNPETTFEIDPAMHIQLQKLARVGGPAIVGVWHSHPEGAPRPSGTDRAQSVEPGWVWLITAGDGGAAETAAFRSDREDPHKLDACVLDILAR